MSAGPYPASSHHLAQGRFQADICTERDELGRRRVLETGRFVTMMQVRAWADVEHAGKCVIVTRYSARDGFQPHAAGMRDAAGTWTP